MKHILVITDCHDVAFNEIRAQILKEIGEHIFHDITIEPVVHVQEFSKINCAFLIRLLADIYPHEVYIMALSSYEQQKPNRIFGKTKEKDITFYGTNNGILSWLINDFGLAEGYIVENKQKANYLMFGGKNDYAPTIGKLALATNLADIPHDKKVTSEDIVSTEIIDGTIVHIDNFGLCKIKGDPIPYEDGTPLRVYKNGMFLVDAVVSRRMMSLNTNTFCLYQGSSLGGMPELAMVRNNTAHLLHLHIGDIITWNLS